MSYHGDIRLGASLHIDFTTVDTTGLPTTLAGAPVISAYPAASLTQLTAGITLTVDFDGVTGLHNITVVASSGNGYATATNYALVITTGTVGGSSVVGYVVGSFSIENRSALMSTTAANKTLDVSATGEAGIDWANIGSPTTAQNLSGTNIDVDQVVASVSGAVGSVTGAVGSVAAGGITAASFAAAALDAVWSTAVRLLTAGTNIVLAKGVGVTGFNDLSAAQVNAEVDSALDTAIPGVPTADSINQRVRSMDLLTEAAGAGDLAAILVDTGTTLDGRIPAALVGGRMDSSVGAVAANAITAAAIADGAIDRATFAADTGLQSIRSNTAQAGAAGTITLDAAASAVDNFYNGDLVYITGLTGAGQYRLILSYVGATKVATIAPNWTTNPDLTSTFAIIPSGMVSVEGWLRVAVNALISGRVDASVGAMTAGVIAAATFAANAIDAAALAADAVTEIQAGLATPTNITAGVITTVTNLTNAPTIGDLTAAMKASVNAEVVDVLKTDTVTLPAQSAPPLAPTMQEILSWLYKTFRNRKTQTATQWNLYNDAETIIDSKATVSDDGVTAIKQEIVSGP